MKLFKEPKVLVVPISGAGWDRIAHLQNVEGKSVVEVIEIALAEAQNARTWKDWE
jgi:hypothetical protein